MTPITLRNLHKQFGRTVAVDHLDLDVSSGDLFFLLGPSGCGKTTLLRMIAGFTKPNAGTIRFGATDVTHLPANRRNCGMVFQNYALWPHLNVRQNVAFGLDVRKLVADEKRERTDKALRTVQMLDYGQRKPNELSGGQQQRVALARALVIEPTVLLLDEPLSNLDARLRLEMRGQIKQICTEAGITAIYVTHDQKEALSMADRIAVLEDGRVVQVGEPRHLYERPTCRFVADFLGETNFVAARFTGREGSLAVLECPAGRSLSAVFPDDLSPGNVTCSIRPEAIRVAESADAAGATRLNRLEANCTEIIYLGEMAQYRFAVRDSMSLKVFELNPRATTTTEVKHLLFAPEDVVVLED